MDGMIGTLISASYKVPFSKFENFINSIPHQLEIQIASFVRHLNKMQFVKKWAFPSYLKGVVSKNFPGG